jgi:hypothetical protein
MILQISRQSGRRLRRFRQKRSVSQKIAFIGGWIFGGNLILEAADPSSMKGKMETLIFAIIASYNAQRHQEYAVAEPQKFQPFDLQALRIPQTTCQTDSASRLEVFASQTA